MYIEVYVPTYFSADAEENHFLIEEVLDLLLIAN